MRVGLASVLPRETPSAATHAPKEVEPKLTAVTRADLRAAIARAHVDVTGRRATPELLETLTAHASLETASGARMFNYNFGGIKGSGPTGQTARCRTHEVVEGKTIEVKDGFRAYDSLDAGARDYVKLMTNRFGGAVAKAERGDVDGFAHALKQAHYYTADEGAYASALRRLSGQPEGAPAQSTHTAAAPPPGLLDSSSLGRVLDAIAQHPAQTAIRDEDDGDDA